MAITTGKVLKYMLLPGILPRAGELFSSGFTHISLFMAYAFHMVRLLPSHHPYLNIKNRGSYGIRHVIAEARRNLVYKKENIDQIIIYYTLLIGFFLLCLQFVGFALSISVQGAFATDFGSYLGGFLTINDGTYDIAYRLLDRTFGIGNIYQSCVAQGISCATGAAELASFPTAFHQGMHAFFHFYNLGILAIGLITFLYLFTTTIAEMAQSGTPFGRRFNRAWAPVRFIIAIGLLVPLGLGFNGSQYIGLYTAKWGSNLATNAWTQFNTTIKTGTTNSLGGVPEHLVVHPSSPTASSLVEFALIYHTCKYLVPWIDGAAADNQIEIKPYQVHGTQSWPLPLGSDLTTALTNSGNQDILIYLGEKDLDNYEMHKGSVKPTCGAVTVNIKDLETVGAYHIQEEYFQLLSTLFNDFMLDSEGYNIALRMTPTANKDPTSQLPTSDDIKNDLAYYNDALPAIIEAGRQKQTQDPGWMEDLTNLGWGGAGIWYNKIAQYNGSLSASALSLPKIIQYPDIMEYVLEQRRAHNNAISGTHRFDPYIANGTMISFAKPGDAYTAMGLYYVQSFFMDRFEAPKGNAFIDTVIAIFGIQGLYDLVANTDIHPLAQLAGVGRSLVESAVTNMGMAAGAGAIGGIASLLGSSTIGSIGMGMGSIMAKMSLMGLSIGFILFYIIPFMPFVYFFFAVGNWVKSIFEAMVGLPLWALAHMRIDGEGIPGSAAVNGYYLLLEIFIRPVLIIVGLIAAFAIFSVQVYVLHQIWEMVIANVVGHDAGPVQGNGLNFMKDSIDEFFYMIIYTIIVFMTGLASFKLIDHIPNQILRWFGASVSSFTETLQDDPAQQLLRQSYGGSQMALSHVQGMGGTINSLMGRHS